MQLYPPNILPALDENFRPAVLANQNFRQKVSPFGVSAVIGLERSAGEFSRYKTLVYPEHHPSFNANYPYIERLVKFLLWQRGGHTLYIGAPQPIAEHIRRLYAPDGERKFDSHFMGSLVYQKEFSVIASAVDDVPPGRETGKLLGRNLQGYRIGFDLGASDRKVSAVVDGVSIYSEEVVWEPRKHSDPNYHYTEIMAALQTAAGKMPRLDAIGGSSAGIYIDNHPMVASLFRSIPPERFDEVRNMFVRIRSEMGVPLEVINDGDVTALAGSMSIEDNGILGIALGSSQAAGYVNLEGHIMGWLNELAFSPIDYSPQAPVEEWSRDRGCGASYFSQQCVFRLAPKAGIDIPVDVSDAERLKFVQNKLEAGHQGAEKIWQSMGVYLGYGIAHYADFYDLRHVLILGRCTSGRGGELLIEGAKAVLKREFPELMEKIELHLPDEKIRRVGQSVAAASLPGIDKDQGR
jgi:predicted NBD/HSP70 family sugar kinase